MYYEKGCSLVLQYFKTGKLEVPQIIKTVNSFFEFIYFRIFLFKLCFPTKRNDIEVLFTLYYEKKKIKNRQIKSSRVYPLISQLDLTNQLPFFTVFFQFRQV